MKASGVFILGITLFFGSVAFAQDDHKIGLVWEICG
jgi:hypothetical protein